MPTARAQTGTAQCFPTRGRPSLPLLLLLKVQDAATCAPIPNAVVEAWHADDQRGGPRALPGWYRGRTTRVHVNMHAGGATVHTGQIYFDDTVTDDVHAQAPYASRGPRDTDNASDGIYASGGAQSLLQLRPRGLGYQGRLTLGVQV